MDKVLCPECHAELTSVYSARSVQLQREGDVWIEKNVFSSGCSCSHCYAELGVDTLDKLGVPNEYR
jgi:ribosomal protein L34E